MRRVAGRGRRWNRRVGFLVPDDNGRDSHKGAGVGGVRCDPLCVVVRHRSAQTWQLVVSKSGHVGLRLQGFVVRLHRCEYAEPDGGSLVRPSGCFTGSWRNPGWHLVTAAVQIGRTRPALSEHGRPAPTASGRFEVDGAGAGDFVAAAGWYNASSGLVRLENYVCDERNTALSGANLTC